MVQEISHAAHWIGSVDMPNTLAQLSPVKGGSDGEAEVSFISRINRQS
jgi:hypothetical protein